MRRLSRRNGVIVVALMLAAVLFLSIPGRERWRETLQDAGHGPVFAIIALAMALMSAPPTRSTRPFGAYARAWGAAMVLGVLTEAVQHFIPGRSVSAMDVLHDAAGAALGLGLLAWIEASGARVLASLVVALAVGVLAWAPVQCALAYSYRADSFPTLVAGRSQRDLYFALCTGCTVKRGVLPPIAGTDAGEPALRVSYPRDTRPRFELFEPMPDWRGHGHLGIDVTNPGTAALPLVLKIQDAEHDLSTHDRLNLRLVVAPGERLRMLVPMATIESAPATRRMDLARMANVALYIPAARPAGEFYVSRIWLE